MIFAGLTLPRSSGTLIRLLHVTFTILFSPSSSQSPTQTDYSLTYYFLLWLVLAAIALTFIFIHGISYVSWPRLLPLNDIIFYDGPGYRSANHGKGFGITALDAKVAAGTKVKGRKRAGSKLEEVELGSSKRTD